MSILQKIFKEHYEEIEYTLHPCPIVMENVEKMIYCGAPSYGGAMYGCPHCGELKFVPFRCHSKNGVSGTLSQTQTCFSGRTLRKDNGKTSLPLQWQICLILSSVCSILKISTDRRFAMDSKFIEELRQKYIKNPPEGGIFYYTKK